MMSNKQLLINCQNTETHWENQAIHAHTANLNIIVPQWHTGVKSVFKSI